VVSNTLQSREGKGRANHVYNETTQADFPALGTPEEAVLDEHAVFNNLNHNHTHLDARYADEGQEGQFVQQNQGNQGGQGNQGSQGMQVERQQRVQ